MKNYRVEYAETSVDYIELLRTITRYGWRFYSYDGTWVHDTLGVAFSPNQALHMTYAKEDIQVR